MRIAALAVTQGDDLHAGEAQMLEQRRRVGLIPDHAIQRLRQHDLELAALRD